MATIAWLPGVTHSAGAAPSVEERSKDQDADDATTRDAELEKARLGTEAKALFAQIVKDRTEPFHVCELEAKWGEYPVDHDTAHKSSASTSTPT